jgi:hypothetical protein
VNQFIFSEVAFETVETAIINPATAQTRLSVPRSLNSLPGHFRSASNSEQTRRRIRRDTNCIPLRRNHENGDPTHEKKDVDIGPVQIQHKQKDTVPLSPILSTVALVGGIGLVVVGSRSR